MFLDQYPGFCVNCVLDCILFKGTGNICLFALDVGFSHQGDPNLPNLIRSDLLHPSANNSRPLSASNSSNEIEV